jgi:Xaa-Pro aminopeptidase
MRASPLPARFHTGNRRRLAESIGDDAIAIIDTADILTRPGDFEYPYRPDSNFYYLTGIDQPGAVLVLVPGHSNPDLCELLFIPEATAFSNQWEGERHTQDDATRLSGVKSVFWTSELDHLLDRLLAKYHTLYLNADESLESTMPSPAKRRAHRFRKRLPLHQLRSAVPLLATQRLAKDPSEIAQIRRAVDITEAGLRRAWAAAKPGLPEYALEAELTAEFIRQGAQGHGFSPIIASGRATTVIHYMKNDTVIQPNDLVLFDVGAEYGYYPADISRVIPVSGRFTDRQRAVYEAVLRVQQAGIKLHKPGATIHGIDEQMRELLIEELVRLKVMTSAQAKGPDKHKNLRQYYPHLSHHLGLDVHDGTEFRAPLAPGAVVTCEPGLYLFEEGIGVRLEDDILITDTGCEVLSRAIPSDPDAIEELLQHRRAKS